MQSVPTQVPVDLMAGLLANFNPIKLERNSLVKGQVVLVTKEGAWVSFGLKAESLVDRDEAERFALKVGDSRTFFVASDPDENGQAILSLARAESWDSIRRYLDNNLTVEARIKGVARFKEGNQIAGVKAEVDGLHAFIPASQLVVRGSAIEGLSGTTVPVKVLKADFEKHRIILSQRKALEEQRSARLAEIQVGQNVVGTVTNVTDFGVFVDIGNGVSGLVHRSQITGGPTATREDLAKLMPAGREFDLAVIGVDLDKGQLSLSLKKARQAGVFSTIQKGKVLSGRVARITSFGAFVELEGCVDGLLHNSALGARGTTAQAVLTIGQTIEVVVLNVNAETEKVSLGLNQPPQA